MPPAVANRRRRAEACGLAAAAASRLQHHDAVSRLAGRLLEVRLRLPDEGLQGRRAGQAGDQSDDSSAHAVPSPVPCTHPVRRQRLLERLQQRLQTGLHTAWLSVTPLYPPALPIKGNLMIGKGGGIGQGVTQRASFLRWQPAGRAGSCLLTSLNEATAALFSSCSHTRPLQAAPAPRQRCSAWLPNAD